MRVSKQKMTMPFAYLIAFAMAFLISSSLIILFTGRNPIVAYSTFFRESFFSTYGILEILAKATPIMIAGSGMIIAFRCGLWNLGAEGQMAIGAIISTAFGVYVNLPGFILLPLIFAASFIGGAIWSGIAGYLKKQFEVHEILTTLLMNYIALKFMEYMIRGPMSMPNPIFPRSSEIQSQAQMIFIDYPLNITIIMALLIIPVVWFLLHQTTLGYQLRAVGLYRDAARLSGMNIGKLTLIVMFLSGGISAIGGTVQIVGDFMRMQRHVTGGYGYLAIVVVMLSWENIIALPFAAFLISGLQVGASALTLEEIPAAFSEVMIGVLLLCVVFAKHIDHKLKELWKI